MTTLRVLISGLHAWKAPDTASVRRAFLPGGLPQDRASDHSRSTGLYSHFSVCLGQFSMLIAMSDPDRARKHCWIPEPPLKRATVRQLPEDRTHVS